MNSFSKTLLNDHEDLTIKQRFKGIMNLNILKQWIFCCCQTLENLQRYSQFSVTESIFFMFFTIEMILKGRFQSSTGFVNQSQKNREATTIHAKPIPHIKRRHRKVSSNRAIEAGWSQKQRQRSLRLNGGQNLFNSWPRYKATVFCLGRLGRIGWIQPFLPNLSSQNI